jgi:predicted N-acetyltransferase YhbS
VLRFGPAALGDIEAILDLLTHYDMPRAAFEPYYRKDSSYRPEHSWIARDNGEILAHLRIYPRRMRLDGGVVRMAGIGNVVIARHARGRGLARVLLERVVEHLDNADYALSLLWTHVPGVYATHGWHPLPQESLIVQFDVGSHRDEEAVEPGTEHDVDAALALQEIADAHRNGTLLRGRDEWDTQRWRLDEGDLDLRVVRQTTDSLRGYVRTRIRGEDVQVLELGAMPGDVPLARALLGASSRPARRLHVTLPPSLRAAVLDHEIVEQLPSQLMVRVCSPELLVHAIGGALQERVGASAETVSLWGASGPFTLTVDASGARLDSVSRTTPLDGARSCSLLLYGAAAPMGPHLEDRPDAARLRRLFPPQDTVFWPVDRF